MQPSLASATLRSLNLYGAPNSLRTLFTDTLIWKKSGNEDNTTMSDPIKSFSGKV